MRAGDLAAPYPTVELSDSALGAARHLAGRNLPGLVVVDDAGRPSTVLPGTQVLGMAAPQYCQDDALMARARSPLVAVANPDRTLRGVITLNALLDRMLGT